MEEKSRANLGGERARASANNRWGTLAETGRLETGGECVHWGPTVGHDGWVQRQTGASGLLAAR